MEEQTNQQAEQKPISMWGYFGYEILFSIPIIGQIVLIVLALSAKNKNVKNFSRSYFCWLICMIVIAVVFVFVAKDSLLYYLF